MTAAVKSLDYEIHVILLILSVYPLYVFESVIMIYVYIYSYNSILRSIDLSLYSYFLLLY